MGRFAILSALLVAFAAASSVAAQPSPRGYVDIVYVPQVEKVLLFGGQAGYQPPYRALGETWWYDPATDVWTEVDSDPTPGPRTGANLALHTPTGTVVMVGGGYTQNTGFEAVNETWTFDPMAESWTQLTFDDGEYPRTNPGEMLAYHEAADTFVLYGGFDLVRGDFVDPTWHFDLASGTWTRVEPEVVPAGRNFNTFAYDPRTERIVMSGGPYVPGGPDEVWTYDPRDATWTEHEPPGGKVDYARMVFDPNSDSLIRFGGVAVGDEVGPWSVSSDLTWSLLEPEGEGPPSITRSGMAAVPGVGVLIFGGQPLGATEFTGDLWLLDTTGDPTWQRR